MMFPFNGFNAIPQNSQTCKNMWTETQREGLLRVKMLLFYDLSVKSTLTRLGQYTQLLRQPRLWSIAQWVLLHIYNSSLKNILKPYRKSAA